MFGLQELVIILVIVALILAPKNYVILAPI